VSPQERFVVALGRNVVLADLVTRKRIASWHPLSHPSDVAFSPDEGLIAVKSTWGEVVVLDVATGAVRARTRPKAQDEGASIHFSPCGNFLVDGSWSGKIRVRQVSDLAVVEEYAFNGEMISATSTTADADLWLFGHKPTTPTGAQRGAPPYLTAWAWPFREPERKVAGGFINLYAAQLAPSGKYIATAGYSHSTKAVELRLLSLSGDVIASTIISAGGTGSSTRWSRDSKLIGAVVAKEFRVFTVPALGPVASFPAQYPSDLAFINNGAEVLLGDWSGGRVVPLLRGDA
jgi:hypothetical protein